MEYQEVVAATGTFALLFFFALFVGVLVWVFWPGAKKKFDAAADIPFKED